MTVARLKMNQCPKCDYTLEGLPEDYVCPECGLEYHGDTTFVRLSSPSSRWIVLLLGAILFAWGMWQHPPGTGISGRMVILPLLMFLFLATLLRWIARVHRRGNEVFVIDRDGIRLTTDDSGAKVFALREIKCAKYSWWTGRLIVYGLNDQRLLSISLIRFEDEIECRHCAERINTLIFAERFSASIPNAGAE